MFNTHGTRISNSHIHYTWDENVNPLYILHGTEISILFSIYMGPKLYMGLKV